MAFEVYAICANYSDLYENNARDILCMAVIIF